MVTRTICAIVISLGLLISTTLLAAADEVILTNGEIVVGEVTAQQDGKVTVVKLDTTLVIPIADVFKVNIDEESRTQYSTRTAKVATAQDAYDLAMWCKGKNLFASYKKEMERALSIDPSFKPARESLGHVYTSQGWQETEQFRVGAVNAVKAALKESIWKVTYAIEDYCDELFASTTRAFELPPPAKNAPPPRMCVLEPTELDRAWEAMDFAARTVFAGRYALAYASRNLEERVVEKKMLRSYTRDDEADIETCTACGGNGKETKIGKCPKCKGTKKALAECPKCHAEGKIACTKCGGSGGTECPRCKGAGTVICGSDEDSSGLGITGGCHGSRKCGTCGGSGWIRDSSGRTFKCSSCRGDGVCRLCKGTGKQDCSKCENGKIDCKHCEGGKVICPTCKGKSFFNQDCPMCNATGQSRDEKECSVCNGKGRWHKTTGYHDNRRIGKQ